MSINKLSAAVVAATLAFCAPAFADGIMVEDAYARSSTPSSPTGAAFMTLMNHTDSDDRLIAASSDVAGRVELHSHTEDANGVMKMGEIEGGIPIAAGGMHMMERGGDHVMLMGLTQPLEQGQDIKVILTFEKAGDVEVMIPVDSERKPDHGKSDEGKMDHSSH